MTDVEEKASPPTAARILFVAAALVVIVAGMRAASSILVPLLLALFLAVLCMPFRAWLHRKGVPNALAALLLVLAMIVLLTVLATFVGVSLNSFLKTLPDYQERLDARMADAVEWLNGKGVAVSSPQTILAYLAPSQAMTLAERIVSALGILFTNGFVIFLATGFILFEASGFPAKLRAAIGDADRSLAAFQKFSAAAQRYLMVKTLIGAATGFAVWLWLVIIGVDYPVIWAVLAFLLNFVPYIGSIFAAVPAVLLAAAQLGIFHALLTAAGYLAANVVLGCVIEPRLVAGGVGLSTVVVFLSLVFWGWVMGPIGSVLSVPLTIIVKLALEHSADTRWIAVMLGPSPPKEVPPAPPPAGEPSPAPESPR